MNWESLLQLMKNPLVREVADLAMQNRDLVSEAARKWGSGRKPRHEEEQAYAPPQPETPPRDESRSRLTAIEAALAETRLAVEEARTDLAEARSKTGALEAQVRNLTASSETLARRLEAAELRAGALDTHLQQALSRITTLEAESARRGRRFAIAAALLAAWSIVAAVLIHVLLR